MGISDAMLEEWMIIVEKTYPDSEFRARALAIGRELQQRRVDDRPGFKRGEWFTKNGTKLADLERFSDFRVYEKGGG